MRVLLAGNTGYLTKKMIGELFPKCDVLIIGDPLVETSFDKKITAISKNYEQLTDIVELQYFDKIVYFSAFLTFTGRVQHEVEEMSSLLEYCEQNKETQLLYITKPSTLGKDKRNEELILRQLADLCAYYATEKGVDVKVIKSPFLYSAEKSNDFLYKLFQSAAAQKSFRIAASRRQSLSFIAPEDLCKLIRKVCDSWEKGFEILNIPQQNELDWDQLEDEIPQSKLIFMEDSTIASKLEQLTDSQLGDRYNWKQEIKLNEKLPELYRKYRKNISSVGAWERINNILFKKHHKLIAVLEVLAAFGICILLNKLASNNSEFKLIDIKLLYVVIVGTIYGIDLGLVAAGLASGLLVYSFVISGTNWLMLFYDPSNWLPFIGYFIIGAICGYLQNKNKDRLNFWEKENKLVQEKYSFVQQLYGEELRETKELRKQILGSKNSFGKIFEVTQKLDSVEPSQIFNKAIKVLEELLENKTISIYKVEKNEAFARLQVASSAILKEQPFSLALADYGEIIATVKRGEVWVNNNLDKRFPMYVTGISQDARLLLLITVSHVDYTQMTLYYQNLFKVLCGLVQSAVLKAFFYKETVYNKLHYEQTKILKEQAFINELKIAKKSKEEQNSLYELLKIDVKNMTELKTAYSKLEGLIRENDLFGIFDDGSFYLLLTQISPKNVPLVLQRFSKAGVKSQVVSENEEEKLCGL